MLHRRSPRKMNIHASLQQAFAGQCASQRYLDLHDITSSYGAFGKIVQ